MTLDALKAALADRYTIERELGAGGMATGLAAKSRGSADFGKPTLGSGSVIDGRKGSIIATPPGILNPSDRIRHPSIGYPPRGGFAQVHPDHNRNQRRFSDISRAVASATSEMTGTR